MESYRNPTDQEYLVRSALQIVGLNQKNVYRVYYLCFIPFFYQLLGGCKYQIYKMYNILTTYTSLTIYFTCIGPKL